eukprot:1542501-Rhodomonas_salina.1
MVDEEGIPRNLSEFSNSVPGYRGRLRPWYNVTRHRQTATWIGPYLWIPDLLLGIDICIPIYDEASTLPKVDRAFDADPPSMWEPAQESLLAVGCCDTTLDELSRLLAGQNLGASGRAFVVEVGGEGDGKLIAAAKRGAILPISTTLKGNVDDVRDGSDTSELRAVAWAEPLLGALCGVGVSAEMRRRCAVCGTEKSCAGTSGYRQWTQRIRYVQSGRRCCAVCGPDLSVCATVCGLGIACAVSDTDRSLSTACYTVCSLHSVWDVCNAMSGTGTAAYVDLLLCGDSHHPNWYFPKPFPLADAARRYAMPETDTWGQGARRENVDGHWQCGLEAVGHGRSGTVGDRGVVRHAVGAGRKLQGERERDVGAGKLPDRRPALAAGDCDPVRRLHARDRPEPERRGGGDGAARPGRGLADDRDLPVGGADGGRGVVEHLEAAKHAVAQDAAAAEPAVLGELRVAGVDPGDRGAAELHAAAARERARVRQVRAADHRGAHEDGTHRRDADRRQALVRAAHVHRHAVDRQGALGALR